jgi:ABC-type glycerol-3-phosphate transport system substrate-binding protein
MKTAAGILRRIIILCLLIGLTACGTEEAEPTISAAPVEVRLVTFDALGAVERALIEEFEAQHPTITINVEQYRQQPLNYLTDATPPDLMTMAPSEEFGAMIEQGLITDISDLWQQANLELAYPAAFRALSERAGKQYLLPIGYTWNAIYYNKALFAQLNLQPPATWDEFTLLCETLLLQGETPLVISGRDTFLASFWIDYLTLGLNGADFHGQLSRGEISYADPRVRSVIETWSSLVERGYFLEESATLNTLASLTALVRNEKLQLSRGKAAMALAGPLFLSDLPEPFRAELDFFPFPTLDPSQPTSEVVLAIGYMIPRAAAHRSEALIFLEYLTSEHARQLLIQDVTTTNLYVPAFATAADDALPPTVQQGMALVQRADELVTPFVLGAPQAMQFPLSNLLRHLLTDIPSGKAFDLDGLLGELETARE